MTAKEKYLAVHSDARAVEIIPRRWLIAHGDDPEHPGYAILGMPFVSEEAAWQNAAESLPAPQEQEAFKKCAETLTFKLWHRSEVARRLGYLDRMDERVDAAMAEHNLKIEELEA